ncbi:calcium-binding protein [Ideonella sp. A 288]|uniref:calcium-binding protein n=1 Tax=Ideonella sp. A 288 TaxID=1962181 RepID=UPI001184A19A|nr:calcium-binding protein [Ideonella sp. A 288]
MSSQNASTTTTVADDLNPILSIDYGSVQGWQLGAPLGTADGAAEPYIGLRCACGGCFSLATGATRAEAGPTLGDDARQSDGSLVVPGTDASSFGGGGNGVTASRVAYTSFSATTEGGTDLSIQNLLVGQKWGGVTMGSAVALTYSLGAGASAYNYEDGSTVVNRTTLNPTQATAALAVMASYAAVSKLTFSALADNATTAGDIRFNNTSSAGVGTAFAYYPFSAASGGDIWFGPNNAGYLTPAVGNYGYHTFLHELGHAVGLLHPHDAPANLAAVPGEDQMKYTVMSYRGYDGQPVNAGYTNAVYPSTLMVNDILALQFMYGANTTYRTGNDVYSWAAGASVFETIWDAGGADTISASTQAQSTTIYLTPGKWSQIGVAYSNGQSSVRDTLTIAYGAVIESAIGSAFADTLEGNSAGNTLTGASGTDSLLGLEGADVLDGGIGNDTLLGGPGNDSLTGGDNDDRLDAGTGVDTVVGGLGTDTVVLANSLAAYVISVPVAGDIRLLRAASAEDVTVRTTEFFAFADGTRTAAQVAATVANTPSTGNDTLTGDDNANSIDGLAGNDSISGLGGNDTLVGGPGIDTLVGGKGDDVFRIDVLADVVDETTAPSGGTDRVEVGFALAGTYVVPAEVENATVTSAVAVHLTGNALDNLLVGNAVGNSLVGNGGNDTLDGGAGTDTLLGGAGDDTYRLNVVADVVNESAAGSDGFDTVELNLALAGSYTLPSGVELARVTHAAALAVNLTGNALVNFLYGGPAGETLSGGAGGDVLVGGPGNDRLDGGADTDLADYSSAGTAVQANLATGLASGGAGNDTLVGIENLVGTGFDDSLVGSTSGNLLMGAAGDDTIDGGAGPDDLRPGLGNDSVVGGADFDRALFDFSLTAVNVDMAAGLAVGEGQDTLVGIEAVVGSGFADTLAGGKGNDDLAGGDGADSITGSIGLDFLDGGAGNDTVRGGDDADYLLAGLGGDLLDGGFGVDTVDYFYATAPVLVQLAVDQSAHGGDIDLLSSIEHARGSLFNDTLVGDSNSNDLSGSSGADSLTGGKGDDTLDGGAGSDTLVGSEGFDTARFGDAVEASLVTGLAFTGIEADSLQGIEALQGGKGNDTLTGDGSDNRLNGGLGNDSLAGGGGNDILQPDGGNDTVDGGADSDILVLSQVLSAYTLSPTSATELVIAQAATGQSLIVRNVEQVQFADGLRNLSDILISGVATGGPDNLFGNAGDDVIDGLGGNDTLSGLGGHDTLIGGTGIDSLIGGPGNDVFRVDVLADQVVEALDEGVDRVEVGFALAGTYTLPPNVDNATVTSAVAVHLVGNGLANHLIGNALGNSLTGAAGDDTLDGGAGTDTLAGGAGNDLYRLNVVADVVNETAVGSDGYDFVELNLALAGSYTLPAGVEAAMLTDVAGVAASLVGNALSNALYGNAGNNTLDGGAGPDQLSPGAGNDRVVGGLDEDWVVYGSSPQGVQVNLATGLATGEGTDTLVGIEHIQGSFHDDLLTGNDQPNQFQPGPGNDIIVGGLGFDMLNLGWASAGVSVDLVAGTTSGGGGNDVFSGIEQVVLTGFDDTVAGSANADVLDGSDGNDSIEGFGSADQLTGGKGADTLRGGEGDDSLNGGIGADLLDGGPGSDWLDLSGAPAFANVDLLFNSATINGETDTLSSIENVIGTSHDDTLWGNAGGNWLRGSGGNDALLGDPGDDTLAGGKGSDQLIGDSGIDTASFEQAVHADLATGVATLGGDTDSLFGIENLEGSSGDDTLAGDGLANRLIGGKGHDSLVGEAGNDTLDAAFGNDTVDGGLDTDTLVLPQPQARYAISRLNATDVAFIDATAGQTVTVRNVEDVQFADALRNLQLLLDTNATANADTLIGDDTANLIDGLGGNDRIEGRGGRDTLVGGPGIDTLVGGADDDVYRIDVLADVVDETSVGSSGTDWVEVGFAVAGTYTLPANVERASVTSAVAVNLVGNELNNVLIGNAMPNNLQGGPGGDVLDGGLGSDVMAGGPGHDSYRVNVPTDVVNETAAGSDGNDGVLLVFAAAGTYVLPAGVEYAHANLSGAVPLSIIGNALDNWLIGTTGANTLDGGAGSDYLTGSAGSDRLVGGADLDTADYLGNGEPVTVNLATGLATDGSGIDTLVGIERVVGTTFGDVLVGDAGPNTLDGDTGNDTLDGGDGNDRLEAALGDKLLQGGPGFDTVVFLFAGVNANLVSGLATGPGNDTLVGIEALVGTDGDDTLVGDGASNEFTLHRGSDSVVGGGGFDRVFMGLSTDGVALDLVTGLATSAPDIDTLSGIEAFTLTGLDDTVQGSSGADSVDGDAGNDSMLGGSGNDTLQGGQGNDTLRGEGGDDLLTGGKGSDLLDGGTNTDRISFDDLPFAVLVNLAGGVATSGGDTDTLAGIEQVTGSPFNDTITGSDADNLLDGGAGNDAINGGKGQDTASFARLGSAVTANLATGTATGQGTDTLSALEHLDGSNLNDVLTGDGNDNRLSGGKGNDSLVGGAGNDTLVGGKGNDTADGGADTDLLVLDSALAGYLILRPTVTDTLFRPVGQAAGVRDTLVRNIEQVQFTDGTRDLATLIANAPSPFNDTLTGTADADSIDGLAGNDTLLGLDGNDTLIGGAGVDSLVGGKGDDTFEVDVAGDLVVEAIGEGFDTVNVRFSAAGAYTLPPNVDHAVVTAAAAIPVGLIGNDLRNNLFGNAAANLLVGGAGNDLLDGGDGIDNMAGGSGNDRYFLTLPTEIVNETAPGSDGVDVVIFQPIATATYSLPAGVENIAVFADDAVPVHLLGNALANTLQGHGGNNSMSGAGGDDGFFPEGGSDTVDGGEGIDTLLLSSVEAVECVVTRPSATQTLFTHAAGRVLVSGVESVQFNDATVTLADLIATIGSPGADSLTGGAGSDTLAGEAGNDTLTGGPGTDVLDGGAGSDTYAFGLGGGLDLIEQNDTLVGSIDSIVLGAGIVDANVAFSRGFYSFDDLVVQVSVGASVDQIVVTGFFQGDGIAPGTIDQLRLASGQVFTQAEMAAKAAVFDSGGRVFVGQAVNDTHTGDQVVADAADWMSGGGGADSLSGLGGADTLFGGAGTDSLVGGTGNDWLAGGEGADTLAGGPGNDMLSGGAGSDVYRFGPGGGADTVFEALPAATWGTALVSGVGPVYAVGSGDLPANVDVDQILLEAGVTTANLLPSRVGDALLLKISGSTDQIEVRDYFANGVPTIERVVFPNGTQWSSVVIRSMVVAPTAGNDTIIGYLGGDVLSGLAGNDQIDGREGNDLIAGGDGADTLTGGSGGDRFTFAGAGALTAVDTITDFAPGTDKLALSAATFTALAGAVGTAIDPDTNAFTAYNPASGAITYDADGEGVGAAGVVIALLGVGTHPGSLGLDILVLP